MTTARVPKGHRLIRSRSGANDAYAQGRCECGVWRFEGWTVWMREVIRDHRMHCDRVLHGKPEYHRHATPSWVQQIPCGPHSVLSPKGKA
jgi:hypothetical protein